jgi:steroid 5-alpha reductase family enzyme
MFTQVHLINGLVIFGLVTALWLFSLYLENASIMDIFWGEGFVIITWLTYFTEKGPHGFRDTILFLLVTIWGVRLALHIFHRNMDKPEDFRYAAWRKEHGATWWWRSYLQVFLLQGLLMWIISTPIVVAILGEDISLSNWLLTLGLIVGGIGFFFEVAGDRQLKKFKEIPANKKRILTTGVWQYTRHPNYFGEAMQWIGFYLFAVAGGGWWTIFSPILMIFLLIRVSGVALLEKTMQSRPGYAEYARKTSAFIPWLPKQSK